MRLKAKSKRRQAKSRTIPTWRLKAKPNTGPAKSKKRSGRSRRCSSSKLGGLCPEHIAAFGATDAPPLQPQLVRLEGMPRWHRLEDEHGGLELLAYQRPVCWSRRGWRQDPAGQ